MSEEASPLVGAKWFLITVSGFASILIAFLTIPLLFLITTAGSEVFSVLTNTKAISSVLLSFETAVASATIPTVFGVPLAFILSRLDFKGKSIVEGILDLPLVLPHTVAGIAVLLAFNSRAPIGSLMTAIGLKVEDSLFGVILAMSFVSSPFAVNFARRGFDSVDIRLEQVARSLGAGPARVFATVSLPLASRSILIGWLMSMARAISEVGAVMIVAYHPTVGSVLVYEWFLTRGLKAASSLSVLLLICLLYTSPSPRDRG